MQLATRGKTAELSMIIAGALALAGGTPAIFAADAASSARGLNAGVELHADARLEDIGLPLFPGAIDRPQKGDEPSGFNFGFHLGSYGWRIHVRSYRSDQPVDVVAAYYLHALKAYGPVLDCARASARPAATQASAASGALRPLACDDDETPAHSHLVYKAGTRADHRVVSLRRVPGGTEFELVRIEDAVGD